MSDQFESELRNEQERFTLNVGCAFQRSAEINTKQRRSSKTVFPWYLIAMHEL